MIWIIYLFLNPQILVQTKQMNPQYRYFKAIASRRLGLKMLLSHLSLHFASRSKAISSHPDVYNTSFQLLLSLDNFMFYIFLNFGWENWSFVDDQIFSYFFYLFILDEKTDHLWMKALEGFVIILSSDVDIIFVSESVAKYLGISQVITVNWHSKKENTVFFMRVVMMVPSWRITAKILAKWR